MVDASTYSVDSILSVVQDQGWFKFTMEPSTVDSIKEFLTTTYLEGILPGLVARYGKDVPVSIRFDSSMAPKSFFNLNEVGAKMHAKIDIIVNNEVAVALDVTDADALVTPTLENFILKIEIIKFVLKKISVVNSLIGTVDAIEIQSFLNVMFRLAIPIGNLYLSKGF